MVDCAFSVGGTLPSTCSTPPPPFDDAVRSNDQTLASGGHHPQQHHYHHQPGTTSPTILTSSLAGSHSGRNKVVHHVTLAKSYHDTVRYVCALDPMPCVIRCVYALRLDGALGI